MEVWISILHLVSLQCLTETLALRKDRELERNKDDLRPFAKGHNPPSLDVSSDVINILAYFK